MPLDRPPQCPPLSADRIRQLLGERAASFDVQVLAECASTNTALMGPQPADGRVPVLVAERQTAGRGRRGRNWLSWPEASLTFSVLWRFQAGAPLPSGLSLVVGLAVAVALENLGVQGVQLKWPNDVLIAGRKVAGILVELQSGRDRTPAAVIGVGVNIALPAEAAIPDQPAVTALAACLPYTPDRNQVLATILASLQDLLDLCGVAGFAALRDAWQQRHAHAGLAVRIMGEGATTEGICQGVDQDGALLLLGATGTQRILSGEVSLRVLS
jgi:BirA family transcriptional regulator, biotin operon repressor / biotin---[acetyl-CoA-carboxylase] ligase